mmetsp:Transcript_22232/g.44998  ORF Transcript_22232/g.44998 Transcript_22232/m.44998 type:complete len:321 (-) Transcript_22232:49-1011(-)
MVVPHHIGWNASHDGPERGEVPVYHVVLPYQPGDVILECVPVQDSVLNEPLPDLEPVILQEYPHVRDAQLVGVDVDLITTPQDQVNVVPDLGELRPGAVDRLIGLGRVRVVARVGREGHLVVVLLGRLEVVDGRRSDHDAIARRLALRRGPELRSEDVVVSRVRLETLELERTVQDVRVVEGLGLHDESLLTGQVLRHLQPLHAREITALPPSLELRGREAHDVGTDVRDLRPNPGGGGRDVPDDDHLLHAGLVRLELLRFRERAGVGGPVVGGVGLAAEHRSPSVAVRSFTGFAFELLVCPLFELTLSAEKVATETATG